MTSSHHHSFKPLLRSAPERGSCWTLQLTDAPGDVARVRLLAVPGRDMLEHGALPGPLAPFSGSLLVDVTVSGRTVLPGAWVEPSVVSHLAPSAAVPVGVADMRLPAVVMGNGSKAFLAWGATLWPLPFDDSVAIPPECRPLPHSTAMLRRLILVALGRRDEIGLTLWQDPEFVVPWHDVRLVPHAAWWFEIAQVPSGMRYRDALAAKRR